MGSLVVIGLGELGTLYGGGALQRGLTVVPGTRAVPVAWSGVPAETPVLIAVGEEALGAALSGVPVVRRDDVILLQNELFPTAWKDGLVDRPTVMVPWVSKKKGKPVMLSRPTTVHGKWAALVVGLHRTLGIPVEIARDETARDQALVSKYAFIVCINVLGVVEDLTLGAWLGKDPARVRAIIAEGHRLGERLVGRAVDGSRTMADVLEAFALLADYPARGRTAAARVKRANEHAARLGLVLDEIARAG